MLFYHKKTLRTIVIVQAVANIRLYCAKGPLLYIKDKDIAYKAWNTLEKLYNPRGFTTEFLTLKELFNTSLSDFSIIEDVRM
jgi:hypothetical protein